MGLPNIGEVWGKETYLAMAASSLVVAVEAVFGLRYRESCRRLVTPPSLLKDELDLVTLWLLEKLVLLLLDGSYRRLNMMDKVDGG